MRRWWQVACRWAVFVALLAAGAYVTLPWWAPRQYLRRQLGAALSKQFGAAVEVGPLTLDWARGVEIAGLSVASRNHTDEPVLSVQAVRAELSPLNLLLRRRLGWLELVAPKLSLRLQQDGQSGRLALGGSPEVNVGRITVRQGAAEVCLPGRQEVLRLSVPSLEFAHNASNRQGSLTMVARLRQEHGDAPITVRLALAGGRDIVAFASVIFSNLDLQGLKSAGLLNLPLRKLQGLVGGSLDVQVDRRGMVNEFNLNILAANLDAQPVDGPQLPVVDRAGLRVRAVFDPFTGLVTVRDLSVRLPGVELAGEAEISADLYEGRLESVRSLDLRGRLQPANLAALLGRQAGLAGDLEMDGPVDVRLSSRCDDVRIALDVAAQAHSATLRLGREVLKPAGTKLEVGIKGTLDRRNWLFTGQSVELALGDNRFSSQGTFQDVRQLWDSSWPADRYGIFHRIVENLARMECSGSWEIRELESLKGFWPALGEVELHGLLLGKGFIGQGGQPRLHVRLEAPAETHLAVSKTAFKPDTAALNLDLSAGINPETSAFRDIDADLTIGDGRCSIEGGLVAADAEDNALRIAGQYRLEKVESLAKCLPRESLPVELLGSAGGRFAVKLAEVAECTVSTEASSLFIQYGEAFCKPAGNKAGLTIGLRHRQADRGGIANFTAETDAGTLAGVLEFPDSHDAPWRLKVRGEALRAEQCAAACPWLRRRLGGAKLGGQAEVTADFTFDSKALSGTMFLGATGVEAVSAGAVQRRKFAGAPLELSVKGGLISGDDRRVTLNLEEGTVALGGGRARFRGSALLGGQSELSRRRWRGDVEAFQCDVEASVTADDSLRAMLPELSDAMIRYGLGGQLSVNAQVQGNGDLVHLRSRADGDKLVFAVPLPAWAGGASSVPRTIAKTAGLPAGFALEATAVGDLSRIDLGSLEGRIGAIEWQGDGSLELRVVQDQLPRDIIAVKGRLRVGTKQAQDLCQMMPWLKPYELSGSASVDASWDGLAGRGGRAELRLDRFGGLYRGKSVRLDGQVAAAGLDRDEDGDLQIGRLTTDGLEFCAGANHGWLLADLTGLRGNPSGEFYLLAEQIDDKDLADWLSPRRQPATAPATPKDRQQAREAANDLLVWLRPYLLAADLKGRLSVDRYRTFDASVNRHYQAGFLNLDLSLDHGLLKVDSSASVNGGSVAQPFSVDFTKDSPEAAGTAAIRNVIASEDIQPQLAKYFPGNTVYGLFDRTEESRARLVDLLARAIDPRYPVYPVGSAKTVTTDGLLKGKALPGFVTRVFPGLNLTKYRYKKMTGFAELQADGTTVNDMVFSGQSYDIYIEGTTDRDNIGRYEIGLILLGTPQTAEWNHAYRLGRIPLLKFKARIEGGQMHDEKVTFVYPNEGLFVIFLKNNLFYRVWIEANKP